MHDFVTLVAEAVSHLYDLPYLQTHRIAGRLVRDRGGDVRGRAVQRGLLDGIAMLKPASPTASAHAWRTYRYLFLRYVQALSPQDVARELAISERQARRTYREAIDALASVLWDQQPDAASSVGSDQPPEAAISAGSGQLPDVGAVAGSGQLPEEHPASAPATSPLDDEVRHLAAAAHGHTTELDEVLAGLRPIVDSIAAAHGCAVDLVIASGLPRLAVDRTVARQIVLNALVMAIQAGPGRIQMVGEADGAIVRLEARHDRRRAVIGGDRLDVVRRLAEAEGGAAEPTEDGTVLAVTLPAARRPLVLVIDDNPDVTTVFRRYLESVDFEVVATDRGEAGVALARELRPLAITLDVMMAGQDGWETLQQLKNDPATQEIPVLICSVLREGELAGFLGAAELLPKPVTRVALIEALGRLPPPTTGASDRARAARRSSG